MLRRLNELIRMAFKVRYCLVMLQLYVSFPIIVNKQLSLPTRSVRGRLKEKWKENEKDMVMQFQPTSPWQGTLHGHHWGKRKYQQKRGREKSLASMGILQFSNKNYL